MLHCRLQKWGLSRAISFLATINATFVLLQVAEKIASSNIALTSVRLFFQLTISDFWRRGGLMVSSLDSGSGGPGSSPGQGTALCS